MKITLAEYNPDWPKMFAKECGLLIRTLVDSVAKIEHIGSTAVPGLDSKPIIDIMVGLADFGIADSLVEKIVNLGYTYFSKFEDVMPDRRFFKKLVDGTATHHIHMTQVNSEFWQRHLLFRNYLRSNPGTAEKYALLKKELAKQDWKESNDFATAKTEFIKSVEIKAMAQNIMITNSDNIRRIRQGKETDFDKIRKVVSAAIRQCVTDSDEHHKSIYADVCSCLDWWIVNKERGLLLVCEDGESISGVALVKEFWNFAALFVDPQRHRSGIGSELITSVIDVCKHKSPKGYLRANSSNYAAAFYKKMGFEQIGDAIDRPGGCVPFKLMFNA